MRWAPTQWIAWRRPLGRAWETENPGGRVVAAIVSNWPVGEPATVEAEVSIQELARAGRSGAEVAADIVRLCTWAQEDPRRRVTHLKGAMNGIHGVLSVFRQDLRAVDAAALSAVWNDLEGVRLPLWERRGDHLVGAAALPIPCGIVGRGQTDPVLEMLRGLAGIHTGGDLEVVALTAGLLSNLAALQVLVSEGIVAGHGRLHGGTGAPGDEG